ncbi:hypothetical protein PIB30_022380, partial [Stylosanthes scabra]|nr:hypothetical protein [Stylosanthes scabra]
MEIPNEEGKSPPSPKFSYKEFLLSVSGSSLNREDHTLEDVLTSEPNSKDRWYHHYLDSSTNDQHFDPCPNIVVSKEEFDQ